LNVALQFSSQSMYITVGCSVQQNSTYVIREEKKKKRREEKRKCLLSFSSHIAGVTKKKEISNA